MIFESMGRKGAKFLAMIALTLIAMGVLMLIFPVVLAVIVAGFFFMAAFVCLQFSWRLFRSSHPKRYISPNIHVEIHEPNDNVI